MWETWSRSPMLRLLLPLLAGAYGASVFPHDDVWWLLVFLLALVYLLISGKKGKRTLQSVLLMVLIFFSGLLLIHAVNRQNSVLHYASQMFRYDTWLVRLAESPDTSGYRVGMRAEVMGAFDSGQFIPLCGDWMMRIEKDSASQALHVNELVWVKARPEQPPAQQNPGCFNYRDYLAHKGIYALADVACNGWRSVGEHPEKSLPVLLDQWREYLLGKFRQYGVQGDEYAVLAALVLGKTDDIGAELMQSYAEAGAVHILAVSGLHVALVYMLLAPVLRSIFPKRHKNRLLKFSIPAVLLWLYAGVTGFSPSVLRAAVMFTAFILADTFQKEKNSFNTMSASALVLICFDPTIVYETGFLLSYLAVIGIVVFQQKITQLVYFRNKLMRSAWSLTAVSIAAQIATLPLTLYYFHQFPLYFLLTNLVLIPLSTVILYTALGFLALSWWGEAASFLGPASAFLTRLMNDITQWSASLPGHLIQDIPFNAFDACMTSLLLIFIMRFLLWKMPRAAIGVLITAIVWLTVTCIVLRMNEGRKEFCFHAIRHEDCVSITDGNSGIWLSSDSLFQDEKRVRRMLRPHAMQQKWLLREERNSWPAEGHRSFDFAGVRVMDARDYLHADVKEEIDVVWFTESSRKDRWDVQVLNSIRAGAVVMAWGISPQKKKFIRDHLPPELPVFDLAEGYVEVKEGRCIQAGSRACP